MNIEYKAARVLIAIAPFAAAFIPAYLLFTNTQEYLGFPLWAALITAIAAEAIGSSAITMYYKAVQHNAYYTAEKNQVKAIRAVWAYMIYLGAVLTVNALLEADIMTTIANAFLSLLSLSGALLLSVHYQIGEVKERYKKKKKTGTKESKPESVEKEVEPAEKEEESVETTENESGIELPIFHVKKKSELTSEMIAELGNGHKPDTLKDMFPYVTGRTIRNWKAEAQE